MRCSKVKPEMRKVVKGMYIYMPFHLLHPEANYNFGGTSSLYQVAADQFVFSLMLFASEMGH